MKPTKLQSAIVCKVGQRFFISPYATTVSGISTLFGFVITVPTGDPERIGASLLEAFEKCLYGLPDNPNDKTGTGALLQASGEKSWSAFHKKALCVETWHEVQTPDVIVVPMQREGRFSTFLDSKQRTSSLRPWDLGNCVLQVLNDAK
jgi:hypothetical protein